MECLNKHIILIGFKHVGKSVVGQHLAKMLQAAFIDLDQQIEGLYEHQFHKKTTCREIMQNAGKNFFSALETTALRHIISLSPAVISLGGATPLCEENRKLIQDYVILHIVGEKEVVYKRILNTGKPAFFDSEEDMLASFNKLWDQRTKIYADHCHLSIKNNGLVADTVQEIMNKLNGENKDESNNDAVFI